MKILTIDVEEWFHLLDNESTKTAKDWDKFEIRIHKNMERIFDLLEKHNKKATFFCLGWVAESYPEVIKEIVRRGYEIGTHTRMHQLVYDQKPLEFAADLEHSIKTLEDLSGQKIKYFRAPGFSIKKENKWVFETLVQQGIEVDCSIFLGQHAHGGFPEYRKAVPSILEYRGVRLKEFPVNFHSIFEKKIIFSGGGYFRLTPYFLLSKWSKESDYMMAYLHPRDLDSEQPIIKELSPARRFKAYVGLKSAEEKFEKWLSDFEFIDIGTAVEMIDWEEASVINV